MAAMDDATGKCVAARFFTFEGAVGYLWLLKRMVKRYGIPLEIYQDQHSALKRNDDHWSLEEQLRGQQDPTQVGRALQSLSVRTIYALSPQAKGRIERLFATLQDRLIAEMELAGITDMPQANEFLDHAFLDDFNRQFARSASQTQKSWRPRSVGLDLDRICSLGYDATVGNDNVVRLGGMLIDIPPGPGRASYAKARVEVRQLLDGSWRVYHKDRCIAKHPKTNLQEPIKVLKTQKKKTQGTKAYSWIYQASAPQNPP